MKVQASLILSLSFFSSSALAENVTLQGTFLDAAEQSTGKPLIVMQAQNDKLVAQVSESQKKIALTAKRGVPIEISCPKEDVVKAAISDMDYMADNCIIKSVNNIKTTN